MSSILMTIGLPNMLLCSAVEDYFKRLVSTFLLIHVVCGQKYLLDGAQKYLYLGSLYQREKYSGSQAPQNIYAGSAEVVAF